MKKERIIEFKPGQNGNGPVVYWMSRDQRLQNNWALIFAQKLAIEHNKPLMIVFCLTADFPNANLRSFHFLLEGLKQVQENASDYNIPFKLIIGKPEEVLPHFLQSIRANSVITDFDPLKMKRIWKNQIKKAISIPYFEIDAHNIVPVTTASPKQEFSAATFRPKISKLIGEFSDEFPELREMHSEIFIETEEINTSKILDSLDIDRSVPIIKDIQPGEKAASKTFINFIEEKHDKYEDLRNDPNADFQSGLSPYLHFGHISSQEILLMFRKFFPPFSQFPAFLEELIVRKELSDNFCYYNSEYDNFNGFHPWAQGSLLAHWDDKREYVYSQEEFENRQTHEDLWNAAQAELVLTGKMHGYMRMYWAKKILEWSENPNEAMKIAIYLNDKYSLDGRDPNGYTGIAWSIGGIHDRAWSERPVFGKIRYMNRNGCARKFDIEKYIKKYL